MEKVKILVVEDEVLIADNICDTLKTLGYDVLEPALTYTEALKTIEKEMPDLAILDIQLSGNRTGIDLAMKIKADYNFPFIFLTSNADVTTISEAKKAMPPAYLIKPFTKEELYTSIEIALYSFSKKEGEVQEEGNIIKDALFIKEKGLFIKLNFADIAMIKSDHVYLEISLKDHSKHIIRGSLNQILEKLNSNFLRIHRGFIVNTSFLSQINQNSLTINGVNVPMSKKYREELLRRINIG